MTYTFRSQYVTEGSQARNRRQKTQSKPVCYFTQHNFLLGSKLAAKQRRNHGGMLIVGLLAGSWLTAFFYNPGPLVQGMMPSIVGGWMLLQSVNSLRDMLVHNPSTESPEK